jgi:hypothetical protein
MSTRGTYSLRLLDATVLVAGMGLGFAWIGSRDYISREPIITNSVVDYFPDELARWAQCSIPILVILSLCIVTLQLIHFRLRLQCFWGQPGTVASATALVLLVSGALIDLTHQHFAFVVHGEGGLAPQPTTICLLSWVSFLDMSRGVGISIAAMWTYMRLKGSYERSLSLLDILGKGLGWTWILIALLPRQR